MLVIDPHAEIAVHVENNEGDLLGGVIPLDPIANNHRKRNKPEAASDTPLSAPPAESNMVEIALQKSNPPLQDKKDV